MHTHAASTSFRCGSKPLSRSPSILWRCIHGGVDSPYLQELRIQEHNPTPLWRFIVILTPSTYHVYALNFLSTDIIPALYQKADLSAFIIDCEAVERKLNRKSEQITSLGDIPD